MNGVLIPCTICGELAERTRPDRGVYCKDHSHKLTTNPARVRDPEHGSYAWKKLSEKARSLQRYCLDCGSSDNLSADHLPQAWLKIELGLPLTLDDVEVVCIDCNSARGSSKIGTQRFNQWLWSAELPGFIERHRAIESRIVRLVHTIEPCHPLGIPLRKRDRQASRGVSQKKSGGTGSWGLSHPTVPLPSVRSILPKPREAA